MHRMWHGIRFTCHKRVLPEMWEGVRKMKSAWNELTQKMLELKMVYEDFTAATPGKKEWTKLKLRFDDAWKDMVKAGMRAELFISEPIRAADVKAPWDNEKFWNKWQYFKTYLAEQFNFTMMSHLEAESLEKLKEWSGDDPEKATEMLSYYIYNHYNKVFKIKLETDERENGERKTEGKPAKNVIRGISRELREDTPAGG
jgi:hypothetical protein